MVTSTLMTAEDLLRLPDEGGRRHELLKGVLVEMPPVGFEHGREAVGLAIPLAAFVRQHRLGEVVVEVGFVLRRQPDTVRAPDVAFVSAARVPPPEQRAGFFEGAPDLAVEILSPSETAAEVAAKVQDYLAAGSRLVWVAEARTRTVTVYRPDGTAQVLRETDTLVGEDVLPGFALPVREIFA